MKKIFFILPIFILTACSAGAVGETPSTESKINVAMVIDEDDGFERSFARGARLAAEDLGFNIKFHDDYEDIKGTPNVMVTERGGVFHVKSGSQSLSITYDYKKGGETAAQKLGEKLKSGKVLMAYDEVLPEDFETGFTQKAKELQLNYEIIKGNDDFERFLPEVMAVVCCDEDTAEDIAEDIRENNLEGKLQIIGFDSGREQISAVERGVFLGAITRKPSELGYFAAKAAYDLAKENKADNTPSDFLWYDRENIKDEEIQACLYE